MTEQNDSTPLNYTREANHRIFVGLGWDPHEKASLIEKARSMAGGKKSWHDLDLSCFLYDADMRPLTRVSAEPEYASNESGKVYHSGDNVEGVGEGDDEQISVELKDLDAEIHNIIFAASIKSGHNFDDIQAPEIHLTDGYTHRAFLTVPLKEQAGSNKPAFVFVHLYRDSEGWSYKEISEFINFEDSEDWAERIKDLLQAYQSMA